jgi:uroporphyrinogen decarboxylase
MAGADVIKLIDDALYATDPILWRGHMKTKIRGIVEAVRQPQNGTSSFLYYCEGDITGIIEDLIEIGVDMIGPVSPKTTPLTGAAQEYQEEIGFWGGIESDLLTGKGSAATIEARVKFLAQMAKNGASIVVAPDRLLGCDISWERVRTLARVVQSMSL